MISVTKELTDVLDDVYVETKQNAERAIKLEARATARELRQISPKNKRSSKRRGQYAKGWTVQDETGGAYVYNATDWQLTHLLEDGHRIFNRFGGSYGVYGGVKHILTAEQHAAERLPIRISRGLK